MTAHQAPAKIFRGRVADQIVEDLRTQILNGTLPDGSRLPAERELAAYYDVSGPTVREAIRVLTAMGLVNTRNGSRATVTAQGDTMLAVSIASVVQVEKVGAQEVFGLLGALSAYAAELAAEHADEAEIDRLRGAARAVNAADSALKTAAALTDFFTTLAEISHNPLLAALCRFITEMQIGLAVQLSGGEDGDFGRVAGPLHAERMRIVAAVASRDGQKAATLARDYHRKALERIGATRRNGPGGGAPGAGLTEALTAWLQANVTLGGQVPNRRSRQS